jgi:hypothetical protein
MKGSKITDKSVESHCSARALGILIYCLATGTKITAANLALKFNEGEKAIATALRELRNLGYLELKREKFDKNFFTKTNITAKGFQYCNDLFQSIWKSGNLLQLAYNIKGPKYLLNSIHPGDGSRYSVMTEKGFSGQSDAHSEAVAIEKSNEIIREIKLLEEQKKQDYEKNQQKTRKKRFLAREGRPLENWTVTDVSFEFADRIEGEWHLKPWRVGHTKFTPALGQARKKHGTDGELEFQMLDRFFETIELNKFTDPEQLWKLFIFRFSELATYVRARRPDPDAGERHRRALEEAMRELSPLEFLKPAEAEIYVAHELAIKENIEFDNLNREKRRQKLMAAELEWEDEAIAQGIIFTTKYYEGLREIKERFK